MYLFVVTGTDSGVVKIRCSAGWAGARGLPYWKPVQWGREEETDSEVGARLARGPIHPETWRLVTPASPHFAAEVDGVIIDPDALTPPPGDVLVEGAGGALVPVTRTCLYADLFARWQIPVIVCARTGLGTINHSLLTIRSDEHTSELQ